MTTATTYRFQTIAQFWVPGEPVGQPRHRSTKTGRMYTPDPKRADGSRPVSAWRDTITAFALPHKPELPLSGAVRVDLTFYMPRPLYLMKKSAPLDPIPHDKKPDKDNLEKLVLDVMTKAGWWGDDCQVFAGLTIKQYHARDMGPGLYVTVSTRENEHQQGTLL